MRATKVASARAKAANASLGIDSFDRKRCKTTRAVARQCNVMIAWSKMLKERLKFSRNYERQVHGSVHAINFRLEQELMQQ